MRHFYHKEDNEFSQALVKHTVEDYLQKAGPWRLTSEAFELIEYNLRIDKEYASREELALSFIHSAGAVANSNNTEEVVKNAYQMADLIIAERSKDC